ncbi:MAG: gliding motility protein GldM [Flavobacteriaceae bacterium]
MAGGQLSARQKMINLMYLIFIAMLALNMGKKVLTSFSRVEQSLDNANKTAITVNKATLESLAQEAKNQPIKFGPLSAKANELSVASTEFYDYLSNLKSEMKVNAKGEVVTDPEKMDQSTNVDRMFFINKEETPKGKELQGKINAFRDKVLTIIADKVGTEIPAKVKSRFSTPAAQGKHGEESWLKSTFEGFPLIASVTNITKMQNDIKSTEQEVYSTLMGGEMKKSVSMTQYDAMVVFEKNAYYPGEQLSGKIVLGKKDPTLKASRVVVNGRAIPQSRIKAGQVDLAGSVGNVGEHEIKGTFTFIEDNKPVNIKIIGGKYSVIPMPNQAIISADKMNVVYRGVDNPISVSMPGVSANKLRASAPGLSKSGKGYVMRPPGQREVTINVSATLPNGKAVTSNKLFRVKDIPSPTGTLSGSSGYQKMSKTNLARKKVGSELKDFVFDLNIQVTSFQVKVPGKAAIKVSGNSFDASAKRAIQKSRRGDIIIIFGIKSRLTNNASYTLKKTADISVEITS